VFSEKSITQLVNDFSVPARLNESNAGFARGFFEVGSKSSHLLFALMFRFYNRANEDSMHQPNGIDADLILITRL
jgi:hypothetical protein